MVTSEICRLSYSRTEVIVRSSSNFGIRYDKSIRYYRADVRIPSLKGSILAVAKLARGSPLADLRWVTLVASNFARFRSYPKSFRIWSFQTDVTSGFQGFCLKASHLGEIVVQSWKLAAEFDI